MQDAFREADHFAFIGSLVDASKRRSPVVLDLEVIAQPRAVTNGPRYEQRVVGQFVSERRLKLQSKRSTLSRHCPDRLFDHALLLVGLPV